jgi:peptide/nickel transport system permease protein
VARYIASRLLALVPVLLGISLIAFFAIRLVPGDVAVALLGQDATPEAAAQMRRLFGIDRPVYVQLVDWFTHLVRLDFGRSFTSNQEILPEILVRMPATLELALIATIISVALAIPLGILSAIKRGGLWDYAGRVISLVGLSIPSFWLALLLIQIVSLKLRLLPAVGYVPFTEDPLANLSRLILPAISLGTSMAAVVARYVRSSLLDVLGQDYVRTARGKGLSERTTIARHALSNALIPVVTIIGIQTGTLIGGTIIVEEIFAWPGLGRYTLQAIYDRNYPVVQTMVMVMAFFFVIINLAVDIAYAFLDPRIRHS